jgi:alkylation response protein AidB-like acyl-CoA dehydrogenase
VPEEYGGLGADRVSYALAFEEIARAWLGAAGLFGPHSEAGMAKMYASEVAIKCALESMRIHGASTRRSCGRRAPN